MDQIFNYFRSEEPPQNYEWMVDGIIESKNRVGYFVRNEIIRQGITVITTDFTEMGRMTARYILDLEPVKEVMKTKIILRNSL